MLVGARLAQGAGAALMAPAGLSILTTTFNSGDDRNKALGVWSAISGLAAAAGVFLGGVLSQGPGWRWVLFVNLPVCALILVGAFRLVPGGRPAAQGRGLRHPRRGPGHRRHAAADLRPGPGARAGLGQRPHDRGAGHRRRPARRLHRDRAAPPRPAVPVLHLPRQGAGRLRRRPDDRVRRVRVGVLLPHPLHAERPGLQPHQERLGLPAGHRRHHRRRRDLLPAVRPHRHPPGDRRRRADRRRRGLVPVPHPGPRHLPERPAPRAGDHGDRDRRRPGLRHHRRQRRRRRRTRPGSPPAC